MTNLIYNYAINAQLAMAAYADLRNITGTTDLIDRLKAKGMSEVQARIFIGVDENDVAIPGKGFEIIHHEPDDPKGFSATVFRNRETGEYHFVNRGTTSTSISDLSTDLNAVLTGGADEQVISMLNYYMRLITPAGESVAQVLRLGEGVYAPTTGTGLGFLDSNTPLNVAGHSLGGHLTDAFIKAFPTIGGIATEAFTYNGLGIGGGLDDLLNDVASLYGITPDTTSDNEDFNVINLIAEPGIDLVPNAFVASNQLGSDTFLFIEEGFGIANHRIEKLADALAVYDLFAAVSPVSEAETNTFLQNVTNILYASANVADQSLEAAVNALGNLIGVGEKVNVGNKEELYTRIQVIEDDVVNNPFTLTINSLVVMDGEDLTSIDTATLVSNAQTSIAYRYALQELNPFVVEGSTSIETDQFYVPHNNNFVLDVENFSDEYLEDRARFLALKIRLGLDDKTRELSSVEGRSVFEDKLSGETIITEKDGKNSASSLKQRIIFTSTSEGETAIAQGDDQADRLYGFQGNDILIGGTGQKTVNEEIIGDYLEGGDGDDTLYSNNLERDEDNQKDILKGGKGKDIYYVGDTDELEDSDRDVQFIEHGGVVVGGIYEKQEDGSYKNLGNENLKLVINGNDAVISLAKDSVTTSFTIKNFKDSGQDFIDGDFGITLREQPPAEPLEFFGTGQDDFIIDIASTMGGEPGSHIINDIPDGEDKEFTSPVQRIEGRGGDDTISINADIPNLVIYGDSAGVNPERTGWQ